MTTPGKMDHRLDIATVGQLVRSQFPTLSVRTVEFLGEGCDFQAYLIDHQRVFRFPKRKEYEARLQTEIAVLRELSPLLPLPVPQYTFYGTASPNFPYAFAGYPLLPGVPSIGLGLPQPMLENIARALGIFLKCLHSYDIQRALALSVPQVGTEWTFVAGRDEALARLRSLQPILAPNLYQQCWGFLQDVSHLPGEYVGPQKLVHADLLAEHILIDPGTGFISGVIDWSDMLIGDPAGDFVGLWVWQGNQVTKAALKSYGRVTDGGMWDRIRYNGIRVAIDDVYYGHETHNQVHLNTGLACLQRVFGKD